MLRGVVEVFTLALQSSLERVHVAGFEPAGNEKLHPRREHAGHVHGSQRVPRNESGHHQDDRCARTLSDGVRDHVDDRLGRALRRRRQRGVEQLVSGAEDRPAHRDVQASWNDPAPGTGQEEAEQAGRADCRRVTRDGTFETETTEQETPRGGLKEERDEAGHGVEEAEEAQEGLALPEVGDGFRLEDVIDEGGKHGSKGHHESQIAEQGCSADLVPPADAAHVLTRPRGGPAQRVRR